MAISIPAPGKIPKSIMRRRSGPALVSPVTRATRAAVLAGQE
ncbi:MAG: hypothetical protein U0703_10370 [Anaerolineae bacterium]